MPPKTQSKKRYAPLYMSFRPGKGLEIRTYRDYFVLRTRLRAQFLYTLNLPPGGQEPSHSFQIRRARLTFTGSFFGKHNKFKAELAVSPRDINLEDEVVQRSPLLDWYLTLDHLRDLTLRLGQYKVPYSRERVISSGDLAFVDRSIVNREFNLDRDLGLDLRSKDFLGLGYLRYYAGIFMGEGHSSYEAGNFGMMYIVRLEVLPLGPFPQDYKEADLRRHRSPRLSLGVAYAFVDDAKGNRGILGNTPQDGGTTDTHNLTADLVFKWRGFYLFAAWMWREGSRNPGNKQDNQGQPIPTEKPRNGMGLTVQATYLLPDPVHLQLGLRFSHIRPLDTNASSLTERSALGGTIGYFFAKHSFKLQVDYFYLWDADISRGSHRVRLQLQAAL